MKSINYLLCGAIVFLAFCTSPKREIAENPETIEVEEEWVELFNGKDLTGWTPKISGYELGKNYKNTFRVENGILKASYDEYDTFKTEFGHLFYEKPYSHYRLRMEYRTVGEQTPGGQTWARLNSGVMLHSQSPESMEENQNFPISIEMQFLSAYDAEDRTTGNLATPGTHVEKDGELYTNHMWYSDSKHYRNDEWVSVEAVVLGDSIVHHIVEGDTVLTYRHPQIGGWELEDETGWVEDKTWVTEMNGTPLKEGYIALQAESHPVEFRKIEILDLSEEYK